MSRWVTPKSLSVRSVHGEGNILFRVKDTSLLQDLGEDGHGRVDGVGNDQDEGLGAGVGDGLSEGRADASVDLLWGVSGVVGGM